MQLCQEEELVWHHAVRICDRLGLGAPIHSDTTVLVNRTRTIAMWGLMIMVWQEGEQAVRICVAISKLDDLTIRSEALGVFLSCNWCWKDPKEDVILHEVVQWSSVTRVAVDQQSEIDAGEMRMRFDESIKFATIVFFLQLQQNMFLVIEEGVSNLLGIWSSCKGAGKKGETPSADCYLAIYLNGFSIWQGINLVNATNCPRFVIFNLLAAPINLLKKERWDEITGHRMRILPMSWQ